MSESIRSGRPTIDVLGITAALVATFFLWYGLVSWWLFVLPAALTIGFAASLLVSVVRSNDESVGSGPTVPGWLLLSVPVSLAMVLWLLSGRVASVRTILSAILVSITGVQFLATLRGGRTYRRIFARYRISWWFLGWSAVGGSVIGIAIVLANGSIFRLAFFFGFVLFALFLWFIVPVATVQSWRKSDATDAEPPYPSVTVIVPAYNEEKCIDQSIESVLEATYPTDLLELIVVDDGSTDATYEKAAQYRDRGVEVYRKENGGKYSALNYGLLCSSGEIVVCVDADGRLAPDALLTLVGEFQADPELGSVAGNVKVGNRNSHLTRLQALEYLVGINTYRRAFSWFGAVPVVPGCLSGFRREALEQVHGYDPDTITEDFDVTVKILREGWKVRQSNATVWTEAPFTLRDLYEQRRRWFTGSAETLLKHKEVLFDDTSGYLHRLSFPFSVLRLFLAPALLLLIYAAILVAFVTHPYETFRMVVIVGFVIAVTYSLLVVRMENDSLWLVLYAPFYVIGYKQFREAVLVLSLLGVAIRTDRTWGSIRRRGKLSAAATDSE